MKNKFLALAVIAITVFTACSKDEANASLQGKWALGVETTSEYTNNVLDTTYSEDYKGAYIVEFTADNKLISSFGPLTDTSKYKVTGNTFIAYKDSTNEEGASSTSFSISGNALTTTDITSIVDGTTTLKTEVKGNYTKK